MNNYLDLLLNDFKRLWGGLELSQKLVIMLLGIITVVAVSFFVAKSTEPNWAVLYSDLTETDSVAVVENLKKSGYQYKISDDKKSILVPSDQKEDLRLMVAQNDVIHDSNPGFELLDKVQLGATDFQNKLTRQRIYQGELTRTIERIEGIRKVRVQLAEPERSVFAGANDTPTASVMVILDAGVKLKQEQVKAIKNLVAYGIPRLTPDHVFVSDQNGTALSDDINKGGSDTESYKTSLENTTAGKVKKVLEKIVGINNVSVEVSAKINFDSEKATYETYLPVAGKEASQGILATSQVESETYDKGQNQQAAAQAPQTTTNEKDKMNYSKQKSNQSYNVSKEVRQVIYAPGKIERMTIAVAINKILTTSEKEEIKQLVLSASGADESRGDIINVTGMEFEQVKGGNGQPEDAAADMQKDSQVEFWVTKIAPMVVMLILGLAALFVFATLMKRPIQGQEVYHDDDNYDDTMLEHEEPELLETSNIPIIEAKLDPELERMKSDLNNVIMSDPAEASRLLLSFIKD